MSSPEDLFSKLFAKKELQRTPELKEIPPKLYRDVSLSEIYLLWRDKELPLKHFTGSRHSDLGKDSVASFWFDRPMVFELYYFEGLVMTEPHKWQKPPEYFQKGTMRFRDQGGLPDASAPWTGEILNSIPEYYLGDRIPIDQVKVFLGERGQMRIKKWKEDLLYVHEKTKEVGVKEGEEKVEDPRIFSIHGMLNTLENYEFGNLPSDETRSGELQKRRQAKFKAVMSNRKQLQTLIDFCDWALALPVVKRDQVSDLDDTSVKPDIGIQ